jgi:hypothetical protein
MAMGRRRKRMRQEGLWTPTAALPVGASHPFYQRLNQILDEKKFDEYVEAICQDFYAGEVGRPGLSPGIYFRLLMVGYFEGIDSERGIAWRASDSLSIRSFVRIALDESVPDHSTISRTRRLMDVETHQAVFQWVLADDDRRRTQAAVFKRYPPRADGGLCEAGTRRLLEPSHELVQGHVIYALRDRRGDAVQDERLQFLPLRDPFEANQIVHFVS